jgi:hypothetical protein
VSHLVIATGPQPPQPGESYSNLGGAALLGGGIAASGFIPFRGGRLWDKYIQGIRTAETAFPGAILRTFRTSEFLSPLESWNRLNVSPSTLSTGGTYSQFLRNVYGSDIGDLSLKRSGAVFGSVFSGGQQVGMGLQITAGTQKGSAIADYYARLSGTQLGQFGSLNDDLLKSKWRESGSKQEYKDWVESLPPHQRRQRLILGAKFREKVRILGKDITLSKEMQKKVAIAETTGKVMRAKAATTAGRLNTLLSKPIEMLPEAWQRAPILRSMAVPPGSATQMLGRYTKKALMAGAAYKGLEYYDYLRATDSPWSVALGGITGAAAGGFIFKRAATRFSTPGMLAGAGIGLYTALSPRFDEGLFHGAASIFTDINVGRAHISEAIGLSASLREQEEVTPGLLSFGTALAFGGIGGMIGGLTSYGGFMQKSIYQKFKGGGNLADILELTREATKTAVGEKFWGSKIG